MIGVVKLIEDLRSKESLITIISVCFGEFPIARLIQFVITEVLSRNIKEKDENKVKELDEMINHLIYCMAQFEKIEKKGREKGK